MTAANGVLHKEYHEAEWSKKGGDFQMIQLWVNLPAKDKKGKPKYQAIKKTEIPVYNLENHGGTIEVIAGDYKGVKGPANTFTPVQMYNARMKKGAKADFSFPDNYNTALLVLEGDIIVNNTEKAPTDHMVLMANDGENFTVEATGDSLVFVFSGEPIDEPIAAHGPFVMNTKSELLAAFEDFNKGKFGYLEDWSKQFPDGFARSCYGT